MRRARIKLTITTQQPLPAYDAARIRCDPIRPNVQLVAPDSGGSFGLKIHSHGDERATCAAAMRLGRPVKFIANRLQSFASDIHARELCGARIAVSQAGEIDAFDVDVLSGASAYSQYPRTSVLEGTQIVTIIGGPYKHKHYRGPWARQQRLSDKAALGMSHHRRQRHHAQGSVAPALPRHGELRSFKVRLTTPPITPEAILTVLAKI